MRTALSTLIVFAVSVCGCSRGPERPATYPVTGTVEMQGRPVEGARVVFVPASQELLPASGVTDAEGRFSLTTFEAGDGAVPGTYGVKVAKYNNWKEAQAPQNATPISYEEEQQMQFDSEKPIPVAKNTLPKKYEMVSTSGITHTVTDGPTTLAIKIE